MSGFFDNASKQTTDKTQHSSSKMKINPIPVPMDILLKQGQFIAFYGDTTGGKSSIINSLPYMDKKHIEKWEDIAPDTAILMRNGGFPNLSHENAIGTIDLDRKCSYLGRGKWVEWGFLDFAKSGYYKIFQIPTAVRNISIDGDVTITEESKADMEFSKNYFLAALDDLIEDPDVEVIVLDPASDYMELCTERFYAMFGKIMPSLMKSQIDQSDLRQTQFSIRNNEFYAMTQKLRESGKWVFLTFNVSHIPPQYQQDPTNIFDTKYFKVSWPNKTPQDIDQISWCRRTTKNEYFVDFKKGPWVPAETSLKMPDTPYLAPYYFNSIAKSMSGDRS